MTAVIYFKATISTTLKLTEVDIRTMKEVERLIFDCIASSDLDDNILAHLTTIVGLLYASRHCSVSLIRVERD